MMTSRISAKGQITIPKRLRDRLGMPPGTTLSFEARDGILLAKRVGGDPLDAVRGILPRGDTDAMMREMRGEPWNPALDPPSLNLGGRARRTKAQRRNR